MSTMMEKSSSAGWPCASRRWPLKSSRAGRQFDLTLAKLESWVEDGKRSMGNALRASQVPGDVSQSRAAGTGQALRRPSRTQLQPGSCVHGRHANEPPSTPLPARIGSLPLESAGLLAHRDLSDFHHGLPPCPITGDATGNKLFENRIATGRARSSSAFQGQGAGHVHRRGLPA